MRSLALLTALAVLAPRPSAAAPDLTPRFVLADDSAPLTLALDDAAQDARHRRRRNGVILVALGVAAAALGTYGFWDANYRPGRPNDALYIGLGNLFAFGLWGVGAGAIAWGTWKLTSDEPRRDDEPANQTTATNDVARRDPRSTLDPKTGSAAP